jgi:hypothetical protein
MIESGNECKGVLYGERALKEQKYGEMGENVEWFCLCSAPPDTGETLHKLPRSGPKPASTLHRRRLQQSHESSSQQSLEDPLVAGGPRTRYRQTS